jgi:hypothetical protein
MVRLDPTILAGEIVATENGPASEFKVWPRPMDLVPEPYHRRPGISGCRGDDVPPSIQNDFCFAAEQQPHGAMRVTNV